MDILSRARQGTICYSEGLNLSRGWQFWPEVPGAEGRGGRRREREERKGGEVYFKLMFDPEPWKEEEREKEVDVEGERNTSWIDHEEESTSTGNI